MPSALDFIASMLLIFFVFAVLVSTLTEIFNSVASQRGKCLWGGVERMLGSDDTGRLLVAGLKMHPAIVALGSKDRDRASYIPSQLFAAALTDVLLSIDSKRSPVGVHGVGNAIAALPESDRAGAVLHFFWRRAGADMSIFEQQLAAYFDQVMDRVSGWYKRGSARRCFLVGLVCAVAFNINAVHVARALWNNPHLAQQYARSGERILVAYTPAAPGGTATGAGAVVSAGLAHDLPIGWPASWYQEYRKSPGQDASRLLIEIGWAAFGFLIMACSCLVGAPIWFQLLGALLPLRLTGPVPARSAPPLLPNNTPNSEAERAAGSIGDEALNYLEQKLIRNKDVGAVQHALGVAQTGQFDTATRSEIGRRQDEFGFEKTGQVTRMFLKKLGVDDLAAKP